MSEISEASWQHPKNRIASITACVSIGVFVFSIFTYLQSMAAEEAASAARDAAQETQQDFIKLKETSQLQAVLLNYAQPHIAVMAGNSTGFVTACRIATAYGEIEAGHGSRRIFKIMQHLVAAKLGAEKNDNCDGAVDAGLEVMAEVSDVPQAEVNLAAVVPVVATYQLKNCEIALTARKLFDENMDELFEGDTRAYEVAVSPTKARVVLNVEEDNLDLALALIRALGAEAERKVAENDRPSPFDRQNLKHTAGAYLAKSEGWVVIGEDNLGSCKLGAAFQDY